PRHGRTAACEIQGSGMAPMVAAFRRVGYSSDVAIAGYVEHRAFGVVTGRHSRWVVASRWESLPRIFSSAIASGDGKLQGNRAGGGEMILAAAGPDAFSGAGKPARPLPARPDDPAGVVKGAPLAYGRGKRGPGGGGLCGPLA